MVKSGNLRYSSKTDDEYSLTISNSKEVFLFTLTVNCHLSTVGIHEDTECISAQGHSQNFLKGVSWH